MGHLKIRRCFQFPASRGIRSGIGSRGKDNGEVGRWQAKLVGERSQVGRGRRIVKGFDDSNGTCTLAKVGIFSGLVGIAARNSMADEVIYAAERGWSFKE